MFSRRVACTLDSEVRIVAPFESVLWGGQRLNRPHTGMTTQRSTLPRLTDRLALGERGLRVSPVCLGQVRDPKLVPAAFDAGVNFFFVSGDLHWPYYDDLRLGLALLFARGGGVRDEVVVAVCSYCTQPEFPVGAMRETVDAVPGMERIDVAVAGGAYGRELLHRYRLFERLRKEQHIGTRAIGASFHDREAAATSTSHGLFDVSYVRYNIVHPGARVDLFPYLTRPTSTLLYNFTNTQGHLSDADWKALELPDLGWRPTLTDHYRFVLTRPEMDGLLVSFGEEAHVEGLAQALAQGPLAEEEERLMLDLGRRLRTAARSR